MQEEWKVFTGFNGYLETSNKGNVRNSKTQRILKTCVNKTTGYRYVAVRPEGRGGKCFNLKVSRLIAKTWLDCEDYSLCVNHKDGIKTNDEICNLEWCTYSENLQHAFDTGLRKGRKGPIALLESEIDEIKSAYIPGDRQHGTRALARKYSVTHNTIRKAIKDY